MSSKIGELKLMPFLEDHEEKALSLLSRDEILLPYVENFNIPLSDSELKKTYLKSNSKEDIILSIMRNGMFEGFMTMNISFKDRKSLIRIFREPSEDKILILDSINLVLNFAFNGLNLNKVSTLLNTVDENLIFKYYSKGFKKEAASRKNVFINGVYYDTLRLSYFKKDFL